MAPKVHTLGKRDRLKNPLEISLLFQHGKTLKDFPIRLVYQFSRDSEKVKAGFSVPKKKLKRAVDRNLVKRRLREAYRTQRHLLDETLTECGRGIKLMWVYQDTKPADFSVVKAKIMLLLQRLATKIKEA